MEKKIKSSLVFLILLELVFLAGAGFLCFQNKKLQSQILEKEQAARNWQLKLLSFDKIKDEYEKIEGDSNKIGERFTNKEEAVVFIQEMEQAAEQSGIVLEIELYTPKKTTKTKKTTTKKTTEDSGDKDSSKNESESSAKTEEKEEEGAVAFQLKTQGTFSDLMKFLVKLENLSRYTRVENVTLITETERERVDGATEAVERKILNGEIIITAL